MNTERLLKLADHLDTVPVEVFDLGTWSCGSVACAVGHACSIPEFQAAGLRLELTPQSDPYSGPSPAFPVLQNLVGWQAVRAFFEIPCEEAHQLFYANRYPSCGEDTSPKDVAARIRETVRAYLEGSNATPA